MTIPNACNGGKIWRWNFQCFLSLHDLLIFIDILFTIQYQNSINFQLYNFKKHIGILRLEFEPEDTRFRRRRILRAMSTPELPIFIFDYNWSFRQAHWGIQQQLHHQASLEFSEPRKVVGATVEDVLRLRARAQSWSCSHRVPSQVFKLQSPLSSDGNMLQVRLSMSIIKPNKWKRFLNWLLLRVANAYL